MVIVLFLGSYNCLAQTNTENQLLQSDRLKINVLTQGIAHYALENNNFMDGRGFKIGCANIGVSGNLNNKFYYKVLFKTVKKPSVLDAYVGYKHNKALNFRIGSMRPMMSLDQLPAPGAMDFITRTTVASQLVTAREIGLAILGDIGNLHYFAGIYNGNKQAALNNNNRFYYMARLQYSIPNVFEGDLKIGANAAYGDSTMLNIGTTGPFVQGKRIISGGDIFWEGEKMFVKAEYLQGEYETGNAAIPNTEFTEVLSGYHATIAYYVCSNSLLLARWQTWQFKESDIKNSQLTIGLKHFWSKNVSSRLNIDAFLPDAENAENQFGVSAMLQIAI